MFAGRRDIVTIGTSAGGVEALRLLVASLPAGLPAAVFVVQHIPPWHKSELPEILRRAGKLPAMHPKPDTRIEMGHIYVAPADQHMILEEGGRIVLWHGPKENRFRPAVNPLFRSAAVLYRERCVGVVLSGALDDGAAGLWWVKRYGGVAAVQDPREAEFPDMPRHAMENAAVDYVLPAAQLGHLVGGLATGKTAEDYTEERRQKLEHGNHHSDQRHVS